MVQVLLIRSGSTDFDEQGRIKGTLDLPLSTTGARQVAATVSELAPIKIDSLYASPCRCAEQTAQAVAIGHGLKVRTLDELRNLDHGLWQGKLVDEVRHSQPKVYRQLQEHPETVCPPEGEPLAEAGERVRELLQRLLKKHRQGTIAIVAPEPLTTLIRNRIAGGELGDLWKAKCASGGWQILEADAEDLSSLRSAAPVGAPAAGETS